MISISWTEKTMYKAAPSHIANYCIVIIDAKRKLCTIATNMIDRILD